MLCLEVEVVSVVHCVAVQVGDQGVKRWMTEYISDFNRILVPSFRQV